MNRLTHNDFHNACSIIEQEKELVATLTIGGTINFIKDRLKIDVTSAQVRNMLDLVGVSKNDREFEQLAALRAICNRLNWPWGTVVTEGKKLLEEEEAKRIKQASASPALTTGGAVSP